MENPLEDQQDKDSESNTCRVKYNSFSPSSGARAARKQLLLGALADPQRSQCARGAGLALSSRTDPEAVLGAQTPSEQWPPSTPSRQPGGHPSAGVASPESDRDPVRSPQASGDRPREVAVGISSKFQAGSARRGSARLCRLPLGDYRDSRTQLGIPPCRNSEPGRAVPRRGLLGAVSGDMCSSLGGKVPPPGDVQEPWWHRSPQPRLPGGGRAASGKQTCVCGEECLLRQVQPRRYFWSQEAPRESSLSGIDCTRWTWHL